MLLSRGTLIISAVTAITLGLVGVAYAPYHTQSAPGTSGIIAQLTTARTHANYAFGSEAIRSVREHLGHTVNCLEGTKGKNYDSYNDNPCEGQGDGIIPGLTAEKNRGASAAAKALILAEEADKVAVSGLQLADLGKAKDAAKKTMQLLDDAAKALR